ncbi:hypothetical protein VO64_1935 [Pseudomonas synxantha]|uniref:Uncharacterized protein n=1 Tax=Pseudomonas synxantha TaxID=47883 RepID=A0AAU8TPI5_9PSED|nr:hypothetical protein VO64_1935 [Pseudomonas synxantha]
MLGAAFEMPHALLWHHHCRSELAREKPKDDASIQKTRVIVEVLRKQACSYSNRH